MTIDYPASASLRHRKTMTRCPIESKKKSLARWLSVVEARAKQRLLYKPLPIKHLPDSSKMHLSAIPKILYFFSDFFWSLVQCLYFCTPKWSCGRVARQSSAKASTAVRIRSGPPKIQKSTSKGCFFVYLFLIRFCFFSTLRPIHKFILYLTIKKAINC